MRVHALSAFRLLRYAWFPVSFGIVAAAPEIAQQPADPLAVLEAHCAGCHQPGKTKGGFDLSTREALLRGGESGAAVVPGKPEASPLIRMIRHEADPHMPHKEPKLAEADIAKLAEWVRAGVPYARAVAKRDEGAQQAPAKFTISDADRNHWAFQPIARPTPPKISSPNSEILNPIDAFIRAKLEAAGLSPSPPASPEVLVRRIYLDLIGLPPTPGEVDAFVRECAVGGETGSENAARGVSSALLPVASMNSPGADKAIDRLIERLLRSPHYGERWGRHWLDLARFAESDGFEHDAVRPHSWRYRDYVVKSFNDDKPYDQFIREQIAGDEIAERMKDSGSAGLRPSDLLVATGFNLLGPDMVDSSDQVQRRHNTLNDMTDTAALAFLGLTMGCARCHDHKFEPLSQRDYYSVQAFFSPAKFERETPIPAPEARAAFDAAMEKYSAHPKVRELAELDALVRAVIFDRKVAKLSPEAQVAHRTPPEKRSDEQENLVLETLNKVKISDNDITGAMTAEQRARRKALLDDVKKLPKPPELPKAMTLRRGDKPTKTFVLHRGEYSQPQEQVMPGFPEVLHVRQASGLSSPEIASATEPAENGNLPLRVSAPLSRLALADWIASPGNPLTARVMVNRIWQHHFGRGIVATPSDFGTHGAKPTHPELLDWLASEFIARGWSMKALHRLMLTSATYRQQSNSESPAGIPHSALRTPHSTDPDNKLLWRMNRLRIEGEVIRDSLLAISGQLNPELGGPGVFPPLPKDLTAGVKGGWPQNDHTRDWSRRSIYIFARRNLRFPFLEVFDAPDNNLSCPARERSTTAPQSLTLLNADEVTAAARLTAVRLMKEAASTDERIALAYRLTLGRKPTPKEHKLASAFLANSPLHELCRALFNLNDFVYAE